MPLNDDTREALRYATPLRAVLSWLAAEFDLDVLDEAADALGIVPVEAIAEAIARLDDFEASYPSEHPGPIVDSRLIEFTD